jgi:hypothetical protein
VTKNKVNIGVLDIETSPYECYTWGLWDQNIGLEQVKVERTVLSFAYMPLGGKPVYEYTGGRGRDHVRDDRLLLKKLWKILDDADILIVQNGKKFDLKVINARMAMYGMQPYSPVRIVDTLQVAKKHFGFSSNKLAWLSKHLTDTPKSEHKEFPGWELWLECLKDNAKAWAVMKKYNIRDIIATAKVYLKLRPWMDNHPNIGVYADGKLDGCPACGSHKLQQRGVAVTQASKYPRFHCQECGKWSKGKAMLTPLSARKGRLV